MQILSEAPSAPRYPKADVRLRPHGKVADVVGATVRGMVRAGATTDDVDAFVAECRYVHGYDRALEVARGWVAVEVG